ncbi:TonB-dependent receptor [Novosphingobium sp. PhB165]|uniref:TonB-dependent receptor n=1 Tax=Novosphingobium sp. PhB165 TaxID=2485105 RepID=UPI001051B928|nr:TonB-dependent receptor [Novosphingobium sp. PhB165]TCM14184.1 TonB-dependent receptor [Novosphingobium sp. PhB165]
MSKVHHWRAGISGAAIILALLLPASAYASDGPAAPASPEAVSGETAPAETALAENPESAAILVTGIRAGLDRAVAVKRNSDTIVDAISAEDVGKFPDVNVAESVQRITGVQINRVRGEGRTVNIRGLPANFTQVTINGRELPNASGDSAGSRTFDFSVLPPEFIRTLAVYKGSTPDLTEGGLAGTVDVRTPRPFEIGKRVISASLQGEWESNSHKFSPQGSAFFSDTFADDRFGISLGFSYMERRPSTQGASIGYTTSTEKNGIPAGSGPDDLNGDGVIEPNQSVRFPNQSNYYIYHERDQRIGGIASFQFRATDALTLGLDGLYTKLNVKDSTSEFLQIFANANKVLSADTVDYLGLPTTTALQVADLDMRGGSRLEDRQSTTYQIAGNATYQVDGWKVVLDGAYSHSGQNYSNLNIADIATGQAEFTVQPGDTLWGIEYQNGFDAARLNPNSYRVASLNGPFNQTSNDSLWEARADVTREFSDEGMKAFSFGFHFTDRSIYKDNPQLTISAAGVSQLYASVNGGVGLPAGPIAGSYSAAPFMVLITPGNGNFLGTYNGNASFASSWLSSDTNAFTSQFTDAQLIAASKVAGGSLVNSPSGITDVSERTLGGYARGDFAFGKLSGNIGFRVVNTRQSTVGASPDLNGIRIFPDAGNTTVVPAAGAVAVNRNYWDFLPSLNLKLDATDKLVLRLSTSRTITRPNLGDVSPSTTVSGPQRTVTANNPQLDPYRATNVDLSAEWYFSKDGLLGATAFYKNLDSLVRKDTRVQSLPVTYVYSTGATQVANVDFNVSSLVNGGGVTVKGVELYYQQAFRFLPAPLDGLGTQLNYTYIDNSDPTQLTATAKNNFNATVYYEKGPLGIRLSYSWRGSYLSSVAILPGLSVYTKPYGSLDGSITYQINSRFSATLQAVNLLDATEKAYYVGGLPDTYYRNGTRVFGGIRVSF